MSHDSIEDLLEGFEDIGFPEECPICGSDLYYDTNADESVSLYCTNDDCDYQADATEKFAELEELLCFYREDADDEDE